MGGAEKSASSSSSKVLRPQQPSYERLMIKHLYLNNVELKSAPPQGQLLKKRQKTSGYLGTKFSPTYPATSNSYWNPTFTEHWQIMNSSFELSPTASLPPFAQERRVSYPLLTDERNLRTSAHTNTFQVTTRVREIPSPNHVTRRSMTSQSHQHQHRTPSARSVKTSAITGRSLFAPSPTSLVAACSPTLPPAEAGDSSPGAERRTTGGGLGGGRSLKTAAQNLRLQRESERKSVTRQRKRLAQVAAHRVDRMYYMQGSASKLHARHTLDEDELRRLRDMAITQAASPTHQQQQQAKGEENNLTVIPTTQRDDDDVDDDGFNVESAFVTQTADDEDDVDDFKDQSGDDEVSEGDDASVQEGAEAASENADEGVEVLSQGDAEDASKGADESAEGVEDADESAKDANDASEGADESVEGVNGASEGADDCAKDADESVEDAEPVNTDEVSPVEEDAEGAREDAGEAAAAAEDADDAGITVTEDVGKDESS